MGTTEDKIKVLCGLNSEVRNDGGLECQGSFFFFFGRVGKETGGFELELE